MDRLRERALALFHRADLLLVILLLAFAVRFAVSWNEGYGFDIGVYQGWARSAVEYGVADSYTKQVGGNMLPDYPPLSITILSVFGHGYKMLFGEFDLSWIGYRMFIKLPAILADVLICALLYVVLHRLKGKKAGLLAALAYAVSPAAIYDSAIWGQTDSIYALFLMAAVAAWAWKHEEAAAVMLAFAMLTKLQAIVLFPLFLFLLLLNFRRILRFSVTGIVTTIIVLLPYAFGNVLENIANVYLGAVGRYSNVTVGAYNFWWAILADKGWRIESTEAPFGGISYGTTGIILFAVAYAFILYIFRKAIRKPGCMEALFYCASLLCIAFFLFLPQMHERYLFPFVVLGVPLIFISKQIAAAYWGIVIAFTINLMGVMPLSAIDKALYREFDTLDVFIASTQVWLFVFLVIAAYRRYAPKRVPH